MINEGIEGITHNLLICDPIAHPRLYQLTRVNADPDVFQIFFTGGVGMITIIFAQYSLCYALGPILLARVSNVLIFCLI